VCSPKRLLEVALLEAQTRCFEPTITIYSKVTVEKYFRSFGKDLQLLESKSTTNIEIL